MNPAADSHDIDHWVAELKAAGWTPKTTTIWRSPHGTLHLGPFGAWKTMSRSGRCDGRYPVPQTSPPRDEPFEVTYRCQRRVGHHGPHGPDSFVEFSQKVNAMNPSLKIAKKLAEGVEFFEKLPDEFQDDAMAEKVASCLEAWKREAQQAIDHDKEPV